MWHTYVPIEDPEDFRAPVEVSYSRKLGQACCCLLVVPLALGDETLKVRQVF